MFLFTVLASVSNWEGLNYLFNVYFDLVVWCSISITRVWILTVN